jgi:glycerophosphoryl diester phosphodiesterase
MKEPIPTLTVRMRPYLSHEHPIRFAHRGSRLLWPENTMVAFQGAVDLGYRYLETDVHLSRDRRVVIFHDDRLERLTDGVGNVWNWDWQHLQHLDAAHHFDAEHGYPLRGRDVSIPLFEEMVGSFPNCLFNLDLKQAGIEQAVAEEIERLGVVDRVLIGSFHGRRIRRFRGITKGRVATSAGPGEIAGVVAGSFCGRAPGAADAFQVPEKVGPIRLVGRRLITAAHGAGKHVHVWTVNDVEGMNRLLDLEVDGIITDRPDLLNRVLQERGGAG